LLVLLESNEGVWQIMQQCWVDDTSSYERFKSVNLTDEVMEGDGNAAFRTDAWDEADSLIV